MFPLIGFFFFLSCTSADLVRDSGMFTTFFELDILMTDEQNRRLVCREEGSLTDFCVRSNPAPLLVIGSRYV